MAERNQCILITNLNFFLFIVLSLGLGEILFKVLSYDLQNYLFYFSEYSPHLRRRVTWFYFRLN